MSSKNRCRRALLAAVLTAASLVVSAPEAQAAASPAFGRTLAGPSPAAMYPSGLEYDPGLNRIVIADTGLDRVLLYSTTGVKLGGFGSPGAGNGQFTSPRDIAVDGASNIYVADAENNRIQKFDQNGTWQWTVGGLGSCPTCLNTPIGVTWDSANSTLLVASTGQSLVKAFDAHGNFRWKSPSATTINVGGIRDATRGPDSRIWVTDYKHHQMKAFDVTPSGSWTNTPAIVLGDGVAAGSGDGQLNFPYNVVFSPDNATAYISDTGNGRVARWNLSGATPAWLPPFGGRCVEHPQPCPDPPLAPGQFNHLRRVAIDPAGNIYAADFWGSGIEVFAPDGTVLRQIEGASAPVPGFAEAYGVDVGPDGTVYVMDRLNHRIERFDSSGTFLNHVGARGTQPGTFSWPEGVAVGPDGTVWALDTRGDRLERFPADLSLTPPPPSLGTTGSALGQFLQPGDLTVDGAGKVWVADTRNHRIQTYDPATATFTAFGGQGPDAGQLSFPEGVAVSGSAVYVADTGNNRVQKFALNGSFVGQFGTGLKSPEGIAVAPDGSVWVADTGNHRLVHLSADLANLGDGLGSLGSGDLQFDRPHTLAAHGGLLYVADTYNHRVQVFSLATTSAFTYQDSIAAPGGTAPLYPAGGATDAAGNRYVADSGGSRIVRIAPDGTQTPLSTTGWDDPRDVELDPDGLHLWVADTSDSQIVKITLDGTEVVTLGGPATLKTPYGLAADATGVYVADTYNHRVVKLTKTGGAALWTQTTCVAVSLSRPRDVAVGSDGNIYVADTNNDRIAVLDPGTGACSRAFGQRGAGNSQFRSPRALTSDGAGGLWVADALNSRIQHLGNDGTFLGKSMGGFGEAPGDYRSPHCVFLDQGHVDVCDTYNYRIQRYTVSPAGVPVIESILGGVRPVPGGFNGPFATAYGSGGELYAVDWFNHRIQKFNPDGTFALQWGGYGSPNGSLIFPRGVAVTPDGATVVVTDSENNRLDLFTPAGAFMRSIKPASGLAFSRPHQTALAGDGTYWVADTLNNRVLHLDGTGAVLGAITALASPQGVAVDAAGAVYVSNTNANAVQKYTSDGTLAATLATVGTGDGNVSRPAGLTIAGLGGQPRLLVADAGNHRIVVLSLTGEPVATFGSRGAGAGQFATPKGVAVDPTDGEVAVADHANHRVARWRGGAGTPPPPPDTTAPDTTVAVPTKNQSFPLAPVAFSGSATDNVGVIDVKVAIKDRTTGKWWRPTGTWGGFLSVPATLSAPGSAATDWSFTWTPPAGANYALWIRAADATGNLDPTPAYLNFTVSP